MKPTRHRPRLPRRDLTGGATDPAPGRWSSSLRIGINECRRRLGPAEDRRRQRGAGEHGDAVPGGATIGLRVYGHRVPNTDKANGCRDTELVVPVAPVNKEQMKGAIGQFQATGFTPIGYSLQEAPKDLRPRATARSSSCPTAARPAS